MRNNQEIYDKWTEYQQKRGIPGPEYGVSAYGQSTIDSWGRILIEEEITEQKLYFKTNVLIYSEIKQTMQNLLDNQDIFPDKEVNWKMIQSQIDSCNEWLSHYSELGY
jgi:hypothetical protein